MIEDICPHVSSPSIYLDRLGISDTKNWAQTGKTAKRQNPGLQAFFFNENTEKFSDLRTGLLVVLPASILFA